MSEKLYSVKPIIMNYLLRSIFGLVIVSLFAYTIFFARPLFNLLLFLIGLIMMIEWRLMTSSNQIISIFGIPMIITPILSLLTVSAQDAQGWIIFGYFCTIWSVDCFAMIFGKIFEGPKLAPYVSPNKTISGLVGACLGSAICVNIIYSIMNYDHVNIESRSILIIYAIAFAILSQMSDLFISIFKRKFNIKDTGRLIPGHGGFLDRFDSIILTAPVLALTLSNF